jgi:hypothetical protein
MKNVLLFLIILTTLGSMHPYKPNCNPKLVIKFTKDGKLLHTQTHEYGEEWTEIRHNGIFISETGKVIHPDRAYYYLIK